VTGPHQAVTSAERIGDGLPARQVHAAEGVLATYLRSLSTQAHDGAAAPWRTERPARPERPRLADRRRAADGCRGLRDARVAFGGA
jgi:hypothetical protein